MVLQRPDPAQLREMLADFPEDFDAFRRDARDSLLEVAQSEYTGSAAEGQVEARCNGFGVLTGITIHRGARDLDNLTLGDAVAEAVRNADAAGRQAFRGQLGATMFGGRSLADYLPTFMAD